MEQSLGNDYYKFIFENSLDAILLTSPDGKIHRANPAACKMFQQTEKGICKIGRDGIVDIGDPNLVSALSDREKFGKVKAQLICVRYDGSKFISDFTSALFKDGEGNAWTAMIIRDITLFKQAEDSLRRVQEETVYHATYDYLTGAMNRRGFMMRLEQETLRASREKAPLSLLLIDIDSYKQINDNWGHVNGDIVLKRFAKLLAENLRPYEIIGRYGGDEFIVCLPNTEIDEAVAVAERLRRRIENMEADHSVLKITASFGVASYDYLEDIDAFITRADNNMYCAKAKRNCVFAK